MSCLSRALNQARRGLPFGRPARRRAALSLLALTAACHKALPLTEPARGAAEAVRDTPCLGTAPLDAAMAQVPSARASWLVDPDTGARMYVLEAGPREATSPPLVLFHGVGPAGVGDFSTVLHSLSAERHVVAVDLPGFGHSDREGDDFGPEHMVRAVHSVVQQCVRRRVDVLGHSSGGALAVLYAAQHQDLVRRLVLVGAAGFLLPESLLTGQLHQNVKDMRKGAGKLKESLGNAVISMFSSILPDAESLSDTGLLGRSPSVLAATSLLDYNFGQAILDVRAETLLVWGTEDEVAPPRIAHLLDDRIPDSEVVFIGGARHLPMDDQPGKFVEIVDTYLRTGSVASERAEVWRGAPREGVCIEQEDLTMEGDYTEIRIERCKHVRLHRVKARRVVIRESHVRLDSAQVEEGVTADRSDLVITGGELGGPVALELSRTRLDMAGTVLNSERAVHVTEPSELVLSVTYWRHGQTTRVLHDSWELQAGEGL